MARPTTRKTAARTTAPSPAADWSPSSPDRDRAIVTAYDYCVHAFRRKYAHCIDDFDGAVALACVQAWETFKPLGPASFNTYAYSACRRALQTELGIAVVSPPRALRREGVRATMESLPEERQQTDIDAA